MVSCGLGSATPASRSSSASRCATQCGSRNAHGVAGLLADQREIGLLGVGAPPDLALVHPGADVAAADRVLLQLQPVVAHLNRQRGDRVPALAGLGVGQDEAPNTTGLSAPQAPVNGLT